ncbi:hypothetical protein C4573_02390 [Candidatus Woesearchaeota archaeon]|nr:MAG: hypothetical protein C4573_02390 [Candidatus Woesearchaeota archaeon]
MTLEDMFTAIKKRISRNNSSPAKYDVERAISWECWKHYRNRWKQYAAMWNANHKMYTVTGGLAYSESDFPKVSVDARGNGHLEKSFFYQWKNAAITLRVTKDGPGIVQTIFEDGVFERDFGPYHMSPLQKLGAYLIWYGLQNPETKQQIGNMMQANLEKPHTEIGGYVRLQALEGKVAVVFLERPNLSQGHSFGFSVRELTYLENFASFHLHAVQEDCSKWLGPSGFDENPVERYWENSDVAFAYRHAKEFTECRAVVVTKLPGKKFAAHYFCTDSTPFNESRTMLGAKLINGLDSIPLGVYSYE